VGGADGDVVESGCDIPRTRATEEGTGEQWFLTPFSSLMSVDVLARLHQQLQQFLVGLREARHAKPKV
jgi:hypothetical protein